MNVPNLPHMMTPLTMPSGHIHPDWYLYFTQLTNEMQTNLSQEGTSIPSQSTNNILKIQNGLQSPKIIYDSDLEVPKISVNGIFKTITTS